MCYTSLISLLRNHELQSEEFWEIIPFKEDIYFRSFGAIYKYDGTSIIPVKRININQMEVYNDQLVIGVGGAGLYFLKEDGELEPLPNQEVLKGESIRELIIHGDQLLIGVRNGLFLFDGERVQRLQNKALDEALDLYELNHVLSLSSDELVIGTLKNGIIYFKEGSGEISIFNRKDGLQNNTVLSMAGYNGKVWMGLDNGIDVVDVNSPIRFFTDESGELGSVYDLVFFKEKLFVATNTGVFKQVNGEMKMLKGAEGHSWNLQIIDNVLYSNHNNGTYKIVDDEFVPVDTRTGSFEIVQLREDNYLIANYTGIDLYNKSTGVVKRLDGINFPVKNLLLENGSTLWATDAYEGIYRITLSEKGDSAAAIKKVSTGSNGDFNTEVHMVNGQILALANGKWFRYNPFSEKFEDFSEWRTFESNRLLGEDGELFWFMNSEENLMEITNLKNKSILIPAELLNNRTVKKNERFLKINDSIFYITLHDGYAKLNLQQLQASAGAVQSSAPIIQKLYDANGYYDLTQLPHIPHRDAKEVTIFAGLPSADALALNYELKGEKNSPIRGRVQEGKIQFQNLPYDTYNLKLTALNAQREVAALGSFNFIVDPPWYLKTYMKVLYVFLLLLLILTIYGVNRMKLQKHRKLLRQKYQREHEERMNRIEKEQLLNEIDLKRKELANSTLMAAKKNEVLMQIQGELNKDKEKFSNQYRLKHIMNKINGAVKNNDEWKVFETNFNELHEDFFKDLLSKYPKLSNRDLKLCAYLKMNLTSKEIAPLMGISVRGVEVHRYRLRKKINVDKEDNLTNWLIANF